MSKRILIIDDEEHIRRMMRITLEASGYAVGEAQNGPVRKPLTPDVLRNAVAAALTKSTLATHAAVTPSMPVSPQPLIQTITMNGFTIFHDSETPLLEERQRRFVVVSPDGESTMCSLRLKVNRLSM